MINKKIRRTLDLGCNNRPRNPYGCEQVYGIDLMPQVIDEVVYVQANLTLDCIPFEDNYFDYVTAFDFIEHVPRQIYSIETGEIRLPFIELMNEIFRVLKPNGIFYAVTPSYPSLSVFTDPTHVNFITKETYQYFCGARPWAIMYGFTGRFSKLRIEYALYDWTLNATKKINTFYKFKKKITHPSHTFHLVWELKAEKYYNGVDVNLSLHNPLISIVIATYNGERFLKEQLDSLINQTYKNIEIIAIDDCSSDNTINILTDYAVRYKNIKIVKNEKNIGYQRNFEKGFLLARGDYIAPCDQDDIWLPKKIEVLVNNIHGYAIAYCDSEFIDCNGDKLKRKNNKTIKMSRVKSLMNFDNPLMYVVGASAPGHAMLIRRQVILNAVPFPNLLSHDNWLGFVATFSSALNFVNEPLVLYRRHDSNVFGSIKKIRTKESVQQRIEKARQRLQLLYDKCPDDLMEEKIVFKSLCKSYESYSWANNFLRMRLFFKYRKEILAYKKHNEFRRLLYCVKVFFKIL